MSCTVSCKACFTMEGVAALSGNKSRTPMIATGLTVSSLISLGLLPEHVITSPSGNVSRSSSVVGRGANRAKNKNFRMSLHPLQE